jgi:hypothetical protein
VRLTQEEYAAVRTVGNLTGARNASDAMRDAVNLVLRAAKRGYLSEAGLDEFRASMNLFEDRLANLEAKLSAPEGASGRR